LTISIFESFFFGLDEHIVGTMGSAVYEIGVEDDGNPLGLSQVN
jgi:GTPase